MIGDQIASDDEHGVMVSKYSKGLLYSSSILVPEVEKETYYSISHQQYKKFLNQ